MKNLFGVIGYPIHQSKSPLMHNAWLSENKIDGFYNAFNVEPKNLEDAVRGMKALGMSGWNVTIPFKERIIPLLDEIDSSANAIGAVNTVVVKNERLIGKNTDGLGFVQSLLEKRTIEEVKNSSILIIGAGGAAKGIYHALAQIAPNKIVLANRTIERAESLLQSISASSMNKAITIQKAEEDLTIFDIVINTTSVGMVPDIHDIPINVSSISSHALACDIIYNPLETTFLKEAANRGADTLNGVGMFVHQGAIAFKYWTGHTPNTDLAIKRIIQDLGGTSC